MNKEQKKTFAKMTADWQSAAEQKAKTSSGWTKVGWALACIACAVAGYFLSGCTATYTQSAEGDISFTTTIVQPAEFQK